MLYCVYENKGSDKMGLVTRRSQQLDKLFDQLAIDPKRKHKPEDQKKKETTDQIKDNK